MEDSQVSESSVQSRETYHARIACNRILIGCHRGRPVHCADALREIQLEEGISPKRR